MAESALTLQLADFQNRVSGFKYGGDGDYAKNSPVEQQKIDQIINDGLRQFYNPPPNGNGRVHEWSFLNVNSDITLNAAYSTGTITVAAGVVTLAGGTFPSWAAAGVLQIQTIDYAIASRDSDTQLTLVDTTQNFAALTTYRLHQDDYLLPADFSAFIGPLSFRPQDNSWVQVQIVGEGVIRRYRSNRITYAVGVNQPWLAAVRPLVNDATVGTRSLLMFWPRILNAGVVTFPYRVRPTALDPTNIYPYGASDHSDTILASIMAVAEKEQEQSRGVYWDDFQRLLESSINLDSQMNRGQFLGYNGDHSDDAPLTYGRHLAPNLLQYRGMVVP